MDNERYYIYIRDLCNINGEFLSYEEFKNQFSLNECFLRYIGIIKCLKLLIRTNKRYKDVCKTIKPTINFNTPVFKLIDDGIIDLKLAYIIMLWWIQNSKSL